MSLRLHRAVRRALHEATKRRTREISDALLHSSLDSSNLSHIISIQNQLAASLILPLTYIHTLHAASLQCATTQQDSYIAAILDTQKYRLYVHVDQQKGKCVQNEKAS